jgi:hypothetical protein
MMQNITGSKVSSKLATVMCGIAKLFVGEIIEEGIIITNIMNV